MAEQPGEPPRQRGRTPKISDNLIEAICLAISQGSYRYIAAKRHGVSATTLTRWMKQGRQFPDGVYGLFRSMLLEAEAAAEVAAVRAVLHAGQEDPKHLEWWLERKFPQRWGRETYRVRELEKKIERLERLLTGESRE